MLHHPYQYGCEITIQRVFLFHGDIPNFKNAGFRLKVINLVFVVRLSLTHACTHQAMKKFFFAFLVFFELTLQAQPAKDSFMEKDPKDAGSSYKDLEGYKENLLYFEKRKEKAGMAMVLCNLGRVSGKLKQYDEAEVYFERAKKLALEIRSYELLKNLYDHYSVYFEDKKDYRNAYKYHVLFSEAQDSLREQQRSTFPGLILQEDTDRAAGSNARYRAKYLHLSQSAMQKNIFVMLVIAIITVAALLLARMRLKRKEELANLLMIQKEVLSRSVIETEEKERSRIARELNDGIGQQLSAARLNISALQSFLKSTTDVNKVILQNAVDLLDDSVKGVRNVSQSMVPNALIKSGLISALNELIYKVNASGNLKINLEVVGLIKRPDPTREAVLFRVLQELIANVIAHARASEAEIQVVKHETELSILVKDNGSGFDVENALKNEKKMGIKNIKSRVAFLNGSVFFDSTPTKGTTVTIEIPV